MPGQGWRASAERLVHKRFSENFQNHQGNHPQWSSVSQVVGERPAALLIVVSAMSCHSGCFQRSSDHLY